MSSRKQQILCELLQDGLVSLRTICGASASVRWWRFARTQRLLAMAQEEAEFLHRIPRTITQEQFSEENAALINAAFSRHVDRMGKYLAPRTARLMIEFYDLIPLKYQPQLNWHPTPELRRLSVRSETGMHKVTH